MANINLGRVSPLAVGDYDSTIVYDKLDIVNYQGSSYIAKKSVPAGTSITNDEYWQLLAERAGQLSIGTVNTVSASTGASASITGTYEEPVLNLNIPRGVAGNESIDDTAGEGDTDKVWSADKNYKQINSIKNGNLNFNSLKIELFKNVTGVNQYLVEILYDKAITIVSGTANIRDSQGDEVYLFKAGKGFLVNSEMMSILVNSTTYQKVSNFKSANNPFNLADPQIGENLVAINKSGFDKLDFDFFLDNKIPYHIKNKNEMYFTNFGGYSTSNSINSYKADGSTIYKAYTPFKYKGTIIAKKFNWYAIYDSDNYTFRTGVINSGTGYQATITLNNEVIVLFSNTPNEANIIFVDEEIKYPFVGKTCSVFGDSLTADAPYYPYLAEITGLQIKNCGIGGTRVSGTGDTCFWQDTRINTLEGDFIIIMGGTNDAPFATVGDLSLDNYDTDTFVGAYNVILSKIYYRYGISTGYYTNIDYSGVEQLETTTFPNIILVTPPKNFGTQTKYDKTKEFCEYVKQIGQWWGLPVVDAFNNMQMNWDNINYFFNNPSNDSTHYNNHGRSKLGALIAAKFIELYSNFNEQI